MTETKLGTRWVGKGEGASLPDLRKEVQDFCTNANRVNRCRAAWYHIQRHFPNAVYSCWITNLALTGEPLTDEDLKRIAECE